MLCPTNKQKNPYAMQHYRKLSIISDYVILFFHFLGHKQKTPKKSMNVVTLNFFHKNVKVKNL